MARGRPKKVIDYETVRKLAAIQCTQEEIANFLDISVRTLQRDAEFCRVYKKGIDNGKMSIRRTQFKLAERYPAMAMFLGKVYLGQRDQYVVKTEREDEIPEDVRAAVERYIADGQNRD